MSPVESCRLGARCVTLSLQYASKIKSLTKHPAHDGVFDNKYMKLFDIRLNAIRTFGLCINHFLTASKDRTDASNYQKLFMEIRDRYRDYIPVYTDGSWDENSVACAIVFPSNTIISMRLLDSASMFTSEIWTLIKTLDEI